IRIRHIDRANTLRLLDEVERGWWKCVFANERQPFFQHHDHRIHVHELRRDGHDERFPSLLAHPASDLLCALLRGSIPRIAEQCDAGFQNDEITTLEVVGGYPLPYRDIGLSVELGHNGIVAPSGRRLNARYHRTPRGHETRVADEHAARQAL